MDPVVEQQATEDLGHCLVTGAAGFVGKNLVEALLARGLKVRALVRNTALDVEHPGLECFRGDIQDVERMRVACDGIDTVFHTAAMIATLGGSAVTPEYRNQAFAINVEGTANVIRACEHMGVKRLVHTSSVDTCFNSVEDLHMGEHTPYASHFSWLNCDNLLRSCANVLVSYPRVGCAFFAIRNIIKLLSHVWILLSPGRPLNKVLKLSYLIIYLIGRCVNQNFFLVGAKTVSINTNGSVFGVGGSG